MQDLVLAAQDLQSPLKSHPKSPLAKFGSFPPTASIERLRIQTSRANSTSRKVVHGSDNSSASANGHVRSEVTTETVDTICMSTVSTVSTVTTDPTIFTPRLSLWDFHPGLFTRECLLPDQAAWKCRVKFQGEKFRVKISYPRFFCLRIFHPCFILRC